LKPGGIALAVVVAASCLTIVHAQETPQNITAPPPPPPVTIVTPSNTVQTTAPTPNSVTEAVPELPAKPVEAAPPKPEIPPGPIPPVRSPTAVLRVLDKVTAETMRFEAPVGRRVRFKSLVFTVKTCETRGASDPLPRPSAYVVIDSEPQALPGQPAPPSRELYRGWMFADSPGLHPFEHPIYDAWLESCTSDTVSG
jgi:hypothetical protein